MTRSPFYLLFAICARDVRAHTHRDINGGRVTRVTGTTGNPTPTMSYQTVVRAQAKCLQGFQRIRFGILGDSQG